MRWMGLAGLLLAGIVAQSVTAENRPLPYRELSPPVPTDDAEKIEVLEFFWYGCPHCYHFEPYVEKWLERQPENVVFRRVTPALSSKWEPHAYFYYTAEVMGVLDKLHKPAFAAIQERRKELSDKESLVRFAGSHGVDEEEFSRVWDSFPVSLQVNRAKQLARRYKLTGVPAVGINGHYVTEGKLAGGYPEMIEAMDELIRRESGG